MNHSIISSILLSCLAVTVNAADLTSVADQMRYVSVINAVVEQVEKTFFLRDFFILE